MPAEEPMQQKLTDCKAHVSEDHTGTIDERILAYKELRSLFSIKHTFADAESNRSKGMRLVKIAQYLHERDCEKLLV